MCGIFVILNADNAPVDEKYIDFEFMKGQNRGPDCSKIYTSLNNAAYLGVHRLSINGLNSNSDQPITVDGVTVICNGEIYNYKQLYKTLDVMPTTDSDCEVIIHMFIAHGISTTLQMLDGVFSLVIIDNRSSRINRCYVARDPHGVKPLYMFSARGITATTATTAATAATASTETTTELSPTDGSAAVPPTPPSDDVTVYGVASDLKCINDIYNSFDDSPGNKIGSFDPGTVMLFEQSNNCDLINGLSGDGAVGKWVVKSRCVPYADPSHIPFHPHQYSTNESNEEYTVYLPDISAELESAVNKRCCATERPIACLLSGGLDSSLITALVNNYNKLKRTGVVLETYSIGLEGSDDLAHAKIVAEYLGTNHSEIVVTEDEMFEAIPLVIQAIESYDVTTVRASIGNYLLGKYIAQNSDAKVIFNGDGADELFGGYLYMHNCKDDAEFDSETSRLLKNINMFDVRRSDKCISSHGLEPRTPFLDTSFTSLVLNIPSCFRNHSNFKKREKYLLRESFAIDNYKNFEGKQIIPDEILFRKKEAFSDGVSDKKRSLFAIIQDRICRLIDSVQFGPSVAVEKQFYTMLFLEYYPKREGFIPYYWMPKYTASDDPSARTLEHYDDD